MRILIIGYVKKMLSLLTCMSGQPYVERTSEKTSLFIGNFRASKTTDRFLIALFAVLTLIDIYQKKYVQGAVNFGLCTLFFLISKKKPEPIATINNSHLFLRTIENKYSTYDLSDLTKITIILKQPNNQQRGFLWIEQDNKEPIKHTFVNSLSVVSEFLKENLPIHISIQVGEPSTFFADVRGDYY